jgi:hypothetical protein
MKVLVLIACHVIMFDDGAWLRRGCRYKDCPLYPAPSVYVKC